MLCSIVCLLMLLRCVIDIRILYYVVRRRRSNAAVIGSEEVVRDANGEREWRVIVNWYAS